MSESPHSDKFQTRYSTPAPELDDHRYLSASLPKSDMRAESPAVRKNTGVADHAELLRVQTALREAGSVSRDFEQAIVDDGESVRSFGRRASVSPISPRPNARLSRDQQQNFPALSRESSRSSRSTSPPNSVEAFADPRRRERANTLESHAPSDLDAILQRQRTISGGTHTRRPTFSNASAIRPEKGMDDVEATEDVCFPAFEEPGRTSIIDFEELEEFVALCKAAGDNRKASIVSPEKDPRVFYDLRKGSNANEVPQIVRQPASLNDKLDAESNEKLERITSKPVHELEVDQLEKRPNRFSFFSSEAQSTVHAGEIGDLLLPGDTFRDLFQLAPDGGVWWLDVLDPTADELGAISRAFSIHPLTAEDIMTQEAREKVELFRQYYFVCFRTFYQADTESERFLEPVNFYMVVFREGVITFSFTENPHAGNVRKRIGRLRDYVSLSSDWICYAMIDDIVDSFGPVIREVEMESEAIEDEVFIARGDDFESFLPRIGGLRKKVMTLMRLLGGKADVIKGFAKRCNEQYSVTPRGDIGLYLGDIQDHVVTMMSNLGHFEKMLSRSHTNYLAQLNVTNLVVGNRVNEVLSKITFLASILVPLNMICGLFGMNVPVPGADSGTLAWFFGIIGVIFVSVVVILALARRYKLI